MLTWLVIWGLRRRGCVAVRRLVGVFVLEFWNLDRGSHREQLPAVKRPSRHRTECMGGLGGARMIYQLAASPKRACGEKEETRTGGRKGIESTPDTAYRTVGLKRIHVQYRSTIRMAFQTIGVTEISAVGDGSRKEAVTVGMELVVIVIQPTRTRPILA